MCFSYWLRTAISWIQPLCTCGFFTSILGEAKVVCLNKFLIMLKRNRWWIKSLAILPWFFLYFSLTLRSFKVKPRMTVVTCWGMMTHSGVEVQKEVPVCSDSTCYTHSCPLSEAIWAPLPNTPCSLAPHPPCFCRAVLICYLGVVLYLSIFFLSLISLILQDYFHDCPGIIGLSLIKSFLFFLVFSQGNF